MAKRKRSVEEMAEAVQAAIGYCIYCQPSDDEVGWILGDRVELQELLDRHDVPEDQWDDVATRLECPNCGFSGFDPSDDVGEYTAPELAERAKWDEWFKKWQPKLEQFGSYLADYPYLGAKHPFGRRIVKAISTFPQRDIREEVWWRARRVDSSREFTVQDMLPPPPDKAKSEGRFNHYGQVVFYLASTAEAALAETLDKEKGDIIGWVQQFQIVELPRVLDLTDPDFWSGEERALLTMGLISNLRRLAPDRESPWKPEYFIPRFISDVAKEHGFVGIMFNSRWHFEKNIVLFQPGTPAVTPVGAPALVMVTNKRLKGRIRELEEFEPEF
jgi:hypothetical protein